jgi:hypothetical protein
MNKEELLNDQVQELLDKGLILPKDIQEVLEEKANSIKTFIEENKDAAALELDAKDEVHKQSQELWNDYTDYLRDLKYKFIISGKELHFIRNYIVNKRVYTEEDIFIGYKLKEEFFDFIDMNIVPRTKETIENLEITINEATLLHHLIKDMTLTNLNDEKTKMFASILTEIGNISKIFNKYNADSEKLSKEIYQWTVGLEPEEREKIIKELEESAKEENQVDEPTIEKTEE